MAQIAGALLCLMLMCLGIAPAGAAEPITIGMSASLTGPLAVNGKPELIAMQIWAEDVNAKGGLLGRPVKLVFYDDQSMPANVPGIYAKLLDIDKVDLLLGAGGTNILAAALPVAIQHNKLLIGLLGTAVNQDFKYPRYFSMNPVGPEPKSSITKGFFDVAMQQTPKPKTVASVASDAEFGRNCSDGTRTNATAAGLKMVYDRTYPPGGTTDMTPIVRAIQATHPDLVAVCSYPLKSVAIIRAVTEIGYTPKMIGGGMVGPQVTTLKQQLGPLLNGIVTFDLWLPAPKMQFPGVMAMLKTYQARAPGEHVDPLGYYAPPWGYACAQVLGLAITATKSLDDDTLANYIRSATFSTVVGEVSFGAGGEWKKERMLQVQYQHITNGSLTELEDMSKVAILTPPELKSGTIIYPYADARH